VILTCPVEELARLARKYGADAALRMKIWRPSLTNGPRPLGSSESGSRRELENTSLSVRLSLPKSRLANPWRTSLKRQIVRIAVLAGIVSMDRWRRFLRSLRPEVWRFRLITTLSSRLWRRTYVDPVFGSTIQRVSNALNTPDTADGGNLTWIENEYATMSAFNSDNSRFILLHQSYFGLYNGASAST